MEVTNNTQQELTDIAVALSQSNRDGKSISELERVMYIKRLAAMAKLPNYSFLLPLLLNLNGKPYQVTDKYFPFETLFRTDLPRKTLLKAGRQVSKSTTLASRNILQVNAIPNFSVLFVAPLFEQIRKFSNNYVRPFIEESPLRHMWCNTTTNNSVLQRSFINGSNMYFSFAFTDAGRTRGISTGSCCFDEKQDMDGSLVPIIEETMSASEWRITMYAGTPKTLDNPIEGDWQHSSQAEWAIPCNNCKKLNIPRLGYDLEKIIGPWREDISSNTPATICARCRSIIDPRDGFWLHQHEDRRSAFPGYHIPQIIMPMHYGDPTRWSELLMKQQGYGNFTTPKFYNEVLGEGYDSGTKLVTKTDLEEASTLTWENNPLEPKEAVRHRRDYLLAVEGIDWGGGGMKRGIEDFTSFTTIAVAGLKPGGQIDIIYGRRLLTPHDHIGEAAECLRIHNMFNCNYVAHDYNGAGAVRETIAVQAGLPLNKVIPFSYIGAAMKDIVVYHRSETPHARDYWLLDKTRAVQLVCNCIKLKQIRFFKHDYKSEDELGLQHDFLALIENRVERPRLMDAYVIQRNPHYPDDFAHAVTYACCAIWHHTQQWPNLAALSKMRLSAAELQEINPDNPWREQEGI